MHASCWMRTTINLDDQLLADLRTAGAQDGTTITAVIEDALRIALTRRRQRLRGPHAEFLTSPGRSFPHVNLDSNAELGDLMDDHDGP